MHLTILLMFHFFYKVHALIKRNWETQKRSLTDFSLTLISSHQVCGVNF